MAMTAHERVIKQRNLRTKAGWVEVRAWVPTKQDAADLKALAAE